MSAKKLKSPGAHSQDIQWHSRTTSRVVAVPAQSQDSSTSTAPTAGFEVNHNNDGNKEAATATKDQLNSTNDTAASSEIVAVFNANTPDGSSVVRALSASGATVVAIVRVFTSKNTRTLRSIPRVTVKVADVLDAVAVQTALQTVHRAVLCLSHWETFESVREAQQAELILTACCANRVPHLVFSTFEDIRALRDKGLKSQLVPDQHGRIRPKFTAMMELKKMARQNGVQLTHLITSYLDQENSKKSLCLIVGENGKLIVQPHMR